MNLSPETKIGDVQHQCSRIYNFLGTILPELKEPIARKLINEDTTLSEAAAIGKLNIEQLALTIAAGIERDTGVSANILMDVKGDCAIRYQHVRRKILKNIILDLHAGEEKQSIIERFQTYISYIDPLEVFGVEQELSRDGFPIEEIIRLSDLYIQVFSNWLDDNGLPLVPKGHPVYNFMNENRSCERQLSRIEEITGEALAGENTHAIERNHFSLVKLVNSLHKISIHFERKEKLLLPILENRGLNVSMLAIRMLDTAILDKLRKAAFLLEQKNANQFIISITTTLQAARSMIYREERILFPVAMETISFEEWEQIKMREREIGYAWIFHFGSGA